ncbi:group II intron maturase-specific domain-containing protein [Lyngbya sp. CCY1209]|uniref:group II intron maturase-specific domain-containing protein n=1 Tax=Lyngbya sp. CCY1209 TaxID=2886103 RepID=UPI0035C90627
MKEVIKKHKTAPQAALIKQLNPIITGWARYYSGVVSSEIFGKLDEILWQQLRAWVVSRCGNAKYKTLRKYFRTGMAKLSNGDERKDQWIFQTKDGLSPSDDGKSSTLWEIPVDDGWRDFAVRSPHKSQIRSRRILPSSATRSRSRS